MNAFKITKEYTKLQLTNSVSFVVLLFFQTELFPILV